MVVYLHSVRSDVVSYEITSKKTWSIQSANSSLELSDSVRDKCCVDRTQARLVGGMQVQLVTCD